MTNVAESGIINTSSTNQTKYYYDSLSQLVREDNPYANKTYTYEYDGNGNIKSKKTYAYTTGTLGSVEDTITYSYGNSDWKDLLTSYDGTAISYDASGNPLNWNDERTITWVGRQLDSIISPDGARWAFKYDHNGLRTEREYSYSGEVILRSEYTWVDEKLVKEERRDGMNTLLITLEYFYNGEELIGFSIQEGDAAAINYYYGKTNNGEIRFIYDSNGNIVTTYHYDAWGTPISTTGTLASTVGRINPFRYKSYYYDNETRFYYLQSRYYDPQVGRFLNADFLWSLGKNDIIMSFNLFAYCFNSPITSYDPNGQAPKNEAKVISLLISVRKHIVDAAKQFKIDPTIIACVIYAEQMLNVDYFDKLTDSLAFFGINTSVGIAQVRLYTARNMELLNYMPKTESQIIRWGRYTLFPYVYTKKSWQSLLYSKLMDNRTNIFYAAAYLKYLASIWEKDFPQIYYRPDIWATLYNIGKTASHSNPKPNLFGRYVYRNYTKICSLFGAPRRILSYGICAE